MDRRRCWIEGPMSSGILSWGSSWNSRRNSYCRIGFGWKRSLFWSLPCPLGNPLGPGPSQASDPAWPRCRARAWRKPRREYASWLVESWRHRTVPCSLSQPPRRPLKVLRPARPCCLDYLESGRWWRPRRSRPWPLKPSQMSESVWE